MDQNRPQKNEAIEWLRSQVARIPENDSAVSLSNMARTGATSALNWLDATNRAMQGYDPRGALEQGDVLAPLGIAAMTAPFSPRNAVGIFGGKLAKTADHNALAQAEKMAAEGASRDDIWNQTGWFQGNDGKWRFEINDVDAKVSDRVAQDFHPRAVGDQVPVQNADRFMDHPELFDAYPNLWRVGTRLTKNEGLPHGHYLQRESGAEGIGISANTLPRATSVNLHELQHAIQHREGFARGAGARSFSPEEVARERARIEENPGDDLRWVLTKSPVVANAAIEGRLYGRAAGEVEARNVQRRRLMNSDERRATPPWKTQDVQDDDQIVRLYADQARSSVPGTVVNSRDDGKERKEYVKGGSVMPYTKSAGKMTSGPLLSDVPGRTDRHNLDVPAGSYVVPADIVSGLGQGNTIAGTKLLDGMFRKPVTSKIKRHASIPSPSRQPFKVGGPVPIKAAGGEYIISPEIVTEIGGGDIQSGHAILDQWVMATRKKNVHETANLPGPQR